MPFLRPAGLADHHTGTVQVIQHAVKWFIDNNQPLCEVCCLYATAPFVQPSDINKGLNILHEKECDYVFAATGYTYPIQRAFKLNHCGNVEMFFPDNNNTRSQDLDHAWHDAGQFYWAKSDVWLSGKNVLTSKSCVVTLPWHRVQDIDTVDDWARAEWIFKTIYHNDTQE